MKASEVARRERLWVMAAVDLLLSAGTIRLDRGEYVGTAADGTEVQLGTEGYEDRLLTYLAARPTPDLW